MKNTQNDSEFTIHNDSNLLKSEVLAAESDSGLVIGVVELSLSHDHYHSNTSHTALA